jgi:hypothetical protein
MKIFARIQIKELEEIFGKHEFDIGLRGALRVVHNDAQKQFGLA